MKIITSTDALAAFCAEAAKSRFITVDTEFVRERTYYPILCLIQVASDNDAVIIDPLAKGIDLAPFFHLMNKEKVMKVFHASRQDLEIFLELSDRLPSPVFDTQIAAMVCGHGESVGYESLVNQLVGATLDKSARFTNWEQRPLTDRQLTYALSDVTHLRVIYEKLMAEISEQKRESWIAEEMDEICKPELYRMEPMEMWKRLRPRSRSPKFLAALQAVAAWRERMAMKMDLPRSRVLKDDTVADIAASAPQSLEELFRLRSMNKGLDKGQLQVLLDEVTKARTLPRSECPSLPEGNVVPPQLTPTLELLKVLLKRQCEEARVAQKLLASKDELELVVLGKLKDTHLSHGWRWEVFGQHAEALMTGNLAFHVDPTSGELRMEKQFHKAS